MRGDDDIFSADGDDLLSGGAGSDTLRGGAGNDVFLFDRPLDATTNVDTVSDFDYVYYDDVPADRIWLDHRVFSSAGPGKPHRGGDSWWAPPPPTHSTASSTTMPRGRSTTTRTVWAAQAQIHFAQFDQFATLNNGPHPVLSFDDFVVVDTSNTAIAGSGDDRVQIDAATNSTSVDHDRLFGNGRPITGTRYDDEILGKDADDTIDGLEGNDLLAGGAGDDVINGGCRERHPPRAGGRRHPAR